MTEFHDHQKLVPAPLKPLLPFLLSGVLLYVYPQVLVGLGYSTADLGGLTPNGPLLLGSVALLLFVKIIFSILSFASGVPGGLLMPHARHRQHGRRRGRDPAHRKRFFRRTAASRVSRARHAGLFSGTVRAPLTGTALVAEMSGAFQCLPEMAIVAFISTGSSPTGSARPRYTTP